MGWFLGLVVFALVWWTVLFCVLPVGVRPDAQGDPETGGWRGAPERPMMGRKLLWTTLVALVVWLAIFGIVESGWISFRDPWLSLPDP